MTEIAEYNYHNSKAGHTEAYLWRPVLELLRKQLGHPSRPRVMDLGCGNGAFAGTLAAEGYDIIGVDPSGSGIAEARAAHPTSRFEIASTNDDLLARFGDFDAVVSLEVVEHVFSPRLYARRVYELLRPGGVAVISTPYHGYLKNLALAASGKLDAHFTALWEGGHIKFWSQRSLGALLAQAGMTDIRFRRVGRVPVFAKSMIATASRSGGEKDRQ